ncbi:MAG: O-antigen ligase family protein [Actinobacteria bacterium]|nr:O-antigen ligase family protein [Actinomycetota bacterium]
MSLRHPSLERIVFAAALAASLVLGAALVRVGAGLAVVPATLALAAALILPARYRGLLVGVVVALAVPSWWTVGTPQAAVFRVASVLALVPLVLGPWRVRFSVADGLVLAFVVDSLLSGFFQSSAPGVGQFALNLFVPLSFYVAARALPQRLQRRLVTAAVAAITVGAITVVVERFAGHPLFQDPQSYSWLPTTLGVFRPGGIYGSPPAASLALAVGLLLAVSLRASAATGKRKVAVSAATGVMLLAMVLTFERSGMLGLAVGALVYLLLCGIDARALLRYSIVAGLVVVAVIVAYPKVQANETFQKGVLRPGTLAGRTSIWQEELPIVGSSPGTATIGVGFGATVLVRAGDTVPPQALATHPRLISTSIHNQYLLILLEQGGIGLAIFLAFVAVVTRSGVRSGRRTHDRLTAGLTAAVVAVLVASLAMTPMLEYSSWILSLLLFGLLVSRAQLDGRVAAARRRTGPVRRRPLAST